MNTKEAKIIDKLVKIAENQQKIISDLVKKAQAQDPMVSYLHRAGNAIAASNNIQGTVSVSSSGDGSYTVQMQGIANDEMVKQKIIDEFYRTIETQKPELDGKVNLLF